MNTPAPTNEDIIVGTAPDLKDSESPSGDGIGENETTEVSPQSSDMQESEQDEEVYIPFGNLAVELVENPEDNDSFPAEDHQSDDKKTVDDQPSTEIITPVPSIEAASDQNEPLGEIVSSDFDPNVQVKEELTEVLPKTYIEDFIYTSGVNTESTFSSGEGKSLSRFPKIAKALETIDSETTATLYQLLFLRSAWDKHEILVQRISNFTGFNCEVNSDDHFNREMMLHSLADQMLLNIAAVLNIEHIKVKPMYFEKEKARLVSLIMKFLNKPQTKSRAPRQVSSVPAKKKATETKFPGVRRKRNSKKKSTSPVKGKVSDSVKQSEDEKKSKEKASVDKGISEPIVSLEKLSPGKLSQLSERNSKKVPDSEKSNESKTSDKESSSEPTKAKLRDFSRVTKRVRGTPEELLLDIHFLLFSEGAEILKLKSNILDFKGFNFDSDSEEYDEKRDFLERMSDKTVNDVAKTFSLEAKNNKDETIGHVLSFLKKPDKSFMKIEDNESSEMSDIELDIEEMFDSDDSVTCEVVPKKVECIDLISSGEESDKEGGKVAKQNLPKPVIVKAKPSTPVATQPVLHPVVPTPSTPPVLPGMRTLRNFETIGKIVNTHPDEYLVDIYELLYLKKHEPRSLRKEILDFSGFDFLKGSPEYIKRKLLLDRMLYNSVRRIYNTLIHTSTEVKMFSKPAMITEIFDFLLKLPDKDTSVNIQTRIKPQGSPYPSIFNKVPNINMSKPGLSVVNPPIIPPGQPGKLSDLKRVFQRVACFPCEYLVDVHKLLFMTDCDNKVIRQNIFGFKGFSFGIDSNEFQQRKMYLEYLTFHSLRKISSVLTTKTVDLRNSTKHELASHLTDVLAEYTNTNLDAAENEATKQPEAKSNIPAPTDSTVEQIVVTPIIGPMCQSPAPSPEPPVAESILSDTDSKSGTDGKDESQNATVEQSEPDDSGVLSISISDAKSLPPVTPTNRRKRKVQPVRIEPKPSQSNEPDDSAQFPDINLPEVENYRQMYGQGLNIYPPNVVGSQGLRAFGGAGFPPSLPHLVPHTVSIPILHAMPSQSHVQNQVYTVHPSMTTPVSSIYQGEVMMPVECILTEDPVSESVSKKPKLSPTVSKKIDTPKNDGSKTSLHDKIRDAMNDTDEEECDKPLALFLGHPNDRILKQQICDIVEQTNLQDITINSVIQKIFSMYPKYDLNYRKEYIKSTLRSVLYRLGDQKHTKESDRTAKDIHQDSPDCSVSTTFSCDNPEQSQSPPISRSLES